MQQWDLLFCVTVENVCAALMFVFVRYGDICLCSNEICCCVTVLNIV